MEDYPSNSNKLKETKKQQALAEKKVEKVITGTARTKKKSDIRKFTDVFISEDVNNVKSYILMDVLVPAIKKAISDIVTNGVDMILYGESGANRKRSTVSKISYNKMFDDPRASRIHSERSRSGLDYDELIFDSRGDAEAVLSALEDIISQFGVASVGDLYDLAQVSTTNYAINKYGWSDLRSAEVIRARDGYMIKLPRALPLN